jgi:hypothetical protein
MNPRVGSYQRVPTTIVGVADGDSDDEDRDPDGPWDGSGEGLAVEVAVEVTYLSGMMPNWRRCTSHTSRSEVVAASGWTDPRARRVPLGRTSWAAADSDSSGVEPSKTGLTGFQTTSPTTVSTAARMPLGRSRKACTILPEES